MEISLQEERKTREIYLAKCSELNKILVELKGQGIGNIPLGNLIDIKDCNLEKMCELLQKDGVKAEVCTFDEEKDIRIFVK